MDPRDDRDLTRAGEGRPPSPRRGPSLFWWTLWMAVALVVAKAVHVSAPAEATAREVGRYLRDVTIVSAADVSWAVAYGVAGQALLLLAARRPRARRLVMAACVLTGTASVAFGMASIHIFDYIRAPLTCAWLYLASGLADMESSLERYLTPWVWTQLVAVPVLYVGLSVWCSRRAARGPARRLTWSRGVGAVALAAVVPWNLDARSEVEGAWGSSHDERLLADNPHGVFLWSLIQAACGAGHVSFDEEFPAADLEDFRPAGDRADRGAPTEGLARGPRNVILVVLESVATKYLGLYGSPYPTTPRLEAEARHALVLDGIYAPITNTAISLVSMVLSEYPAELSHKEPTKETPRMPGTGVAAALRGAGRRTAFISSGNNAYANQAEFLEDRGFDALWDWKASGHPEVNTWGAEDAAMVDMLLRWIDQDRARPFFAMTWTQGTHHPYGVHWEAPEREWFGADSAVPEKWRWDLGKYLDQVREADLQVGRLLDGLRERGLADDTIVLVTGDHGDAFEDPHRGICGHSYHVYDEDVRVPLVVWNPKLFPEGRRERRIGGLLDLGPTILDLLGLASPASWQGRSLFSPAHPGRAYAYGARDPYTLGVREGRFKYIVNVTWGKEELYDLDADPREQRSVHAEHPDVCRRLRQRLAAWFSHQKRSGAPGGAAR